MQVTLDADYLKRVLIIINMKFAVATAGKEGHLCTSELGKEFVVKANSYILTIMKISTSCCQIAL